MPRIPGIYLNYTGCEEHCQLSGNYYFSLECPNTVGCHMVAPKYHKILKLFRIRKNGLQSELNRK